MSARFDQQTSVDSVYQTMGSLSNKGLKNPSGDNNCFLNSSIQVRERTRLVDVILLGLPVDSLAFGRLPKKLSARVRRIASREMPTGQSLRRLFAGSRARLGRVYPTFPMHFLQVMFTQYQHSQMTVLPPDVMRQAMAHSFAVRKRK